MMMKSASSSTRNTTFIETAKTLLVCAHCEVAIRPPMECVRKNYNGEEWVLCMACHDAFQKLCNEIAGKAMGFHLVRTARKHFRRLAQP
ncbi:MAG TPA: hypothetical protein VLZ30_04300 [Verrucomicrobiae bacterium]|nr:hypothetical protein [Verrucomicrobiae bacterium]